MSDPVVVDPVPQAVPPEPMDLELLEDQVIEFLGRALHQASARVLLAMQGGLVWGNSDDARVATALIKMMPQLLPLVQKLDEHRQRQVQVIPVCPWCGEGPNKHWFQECPRVHPDNRNRFVFDYLQYRRIRMRDVRQNGIRYFAKPGESPARADALNELKFDHDEFAQDRDCLRRIEEVENATTS